MNGEELMQLTHHMRDIQLEGKREREEHYTVTLQKLTEIIDRNYYYGLLTKPVVTLISSFGGIELMRAANKWKIAISMCSICTVWNSLPDELRDSKSFDSFKWFMKTILFSHYQCVQQLTTKLTQPSIPVGQEN